MTVSPAAELLGHPAFQGLGEQSLAALQDQSSLVQFRVGQLLADSKVLPAQVLVIQQGQARQTARAQGKLIPLGKIGPGSVVGLVSLLRASPCEEVSASTELIAAAIPDRLILDLYTAEPSFRDWCSSQVW